MHTYTPTHVLGTSRNEFPAVSYIHTTQQIPTEDNVAYDQAKPQIWTEDNVAYGQSTPQISTEQNVAYSEATLQITTGDNVAYHGHKGGTYATISNPPEYDYVPL